MKRLKWSLALAAGLTAGSVATASAQQAAAPAAAAPVKLGIVSFLSGPAASPFGVPGRNGAEIVIEALNSGKAPAPYDKVGLGGAKIEIKWVDEAGSTAQVVTEFRNLVQRDQVDAVVGYISSGSCLAVTPVADELKALTVYFDCGTPRIFEEKPRKYVFRPTRRMRPWTNDRRGALPARQEKGHHAVLRHQPELRLGPGLLEGLRRRHERAGAEGQGRQGAVPQAVPGRVRCGNLHAADLEVAGAAFQLLGRRPGELHHPERRARSRQAHAVRRHHRGVVDLARLRDKMPDGTIVGARGPHGPLAPDNALNKWFKSIYMDRYGTPPTYPSYQMALSILGLKVAWEKAAAAKGGAKPTTDEVVAAFEGIEYDSPSGNVKMALGDGHQGIQATAYGTYRFNKQKNEPEVIDVDPLQRGVRQSAVRQDLGGVDQGRHARREVLSVVF